MEVSAVVVGLWIKRASFVCSLRWHEGVCVRLQAGDGRGCAVHRDECYSPGTITVSFGACLVLVVWGRSGDQVLCTCLVLLSLEVRLSRQ
jgi:hypothetical protein